MTKLVDIECEVVHQTENAILIDNGSKDNFWIPKSLAETDYIDITGNKAIVTIPEYFAIEKGIV